MSPSVAKNSGAIPTTLARLGAIRFWLAVCLTGVGTGLAAALLTRLLEVVQRLAWRGSATNILAAAQQANASRHLVVLLTAAIVTGVFPSSLASLNSSGS